MAFDSFGKPEQVRKAQVAGDTEKLRAFGRKGAEVARQNRERRAEEDAIFDEIQEEEAKLEEYERAKQANEHITPIEPEED